MGQFSLTHLLLLGIFALIFFGPNRLPALGHSLGKAIRGFKQGLSEIDAESEAITEQKAQPYPQSLTHSQTQQINAPPQHTAPLASAAAPPTAAPAAASTTSSVSPASYASPSGPASSTNPITSSAVQQTSPPPPPPQV